VKKTRKAAVPCKVFPDEDAGDRVAVVGEPKPNLASKNGIRFMRLTPGFRAISGKTEDLIESYCKLNGNMIINHWTFGTFLFATRPRPEVTGLKVNELHLYLIS
jgi:hypothetical protein